MMPFNGYGSYLIREHNTIPGVYSLSVRDRDQVKQYKIKQLENGQFFVIGHATFGTVENLVTYYQQQADGLCVNLIQPCALSEKHQTITFSKQVNDKWEGDRRQIRFLKKLVEGKFGEVWEGVWNETTPISVKICKPQNFSIMTVSDFLQTAALMEKLCHPNIIQFYTVCIEEEPIYIITELMKHGSLLGYFCGEGKSTQLPHLIDMASQVARGMAYLEELNYVHRDLAARNILVGENLICKVANFEMARVIDDAQSQAEVATKWMALEAILYNKFTTKSDVWSFGIVLYEIITYGRFPYPNMTNTEVLMQVQQGYRMPQPTSWTNKRCPDNLYDIMLDCWQEEPANRPTFKSLQWTLEHFFVFHN